MSILKVTFHYHSPVSREHSVSEDTPPSTFEHYHQNWKRYLQDCALVLQSLSINMKDRIYTHKHLNRTSEEKVARKIHLQSLFFMFKFVNFLFIMLLKD